MAGRRENYDPDGDIPDPRDEREARWDDRDDPREEDMDDADDGDESPLEQCPMCKREISGWADRCPYCGNEDLRDSRTRPWVRYTGAAILIVLLVGTGLVSWIVAWVMRSLK
ncbi:MAG: hypothetical protein JNG88_12290 [Phycisphaerales bacterium]|nr:hypothetical protein [Phycisphaerales bacterium]